MLIWLLDRFAPLSEQVEIYATGDSRVFLTARIALASITSFLIALLFGPFAIRWLKGRFTERIASDSERLNELQKDKAQTPTMGGLFIVAATVIALLLWGELTSPFTQLGLFTVLAFGSLGAVDDWTKLRTSKNGMSTRRKFQCQLLLSSVVSVWLYFVMDDVPRGLQLIWPIGNRGLYLGFGFILWSMLVIVGTSNAVNLTDGLDGLAAGCSIFSGGALAVVAYLAGHKVLSDYLSIPYIPGSGEIAISLGALVGSLLGFLWFNSHPAQIFMGDTGSLAIGALLALSALVTKQEVLLVVIGGVFVVETLSVILQVAWFKRTGNRILACSPLHNHFLFEGQHEIKIVTRFWIVAALLAILGLASLKIR